MAFTDGAALRRQCAGTLLLLACGLAFTACGGSEDSYSDAGRVSNTRNVRHRVKPAVTERKAAAGAVMAVHSRDGAANLSKEYASLAARGRAASAAELAQATNELRGFLKARAAERWSAACAHLAGVQRGGDKVRTRCIRLMADSWSEVSATRRYEFSQAEVRSLRVTGMRAVLIYGGANRVTYFMPMAIEGNRWMINGLTAMSNTAEIR